jgi:uncharacterized circularly permuted ATP-grasp superfamily protein
LRNHFQKIFVFLEQHLDRVNMRNQMIAYLLSASNLKAQELEALLKNIFSPVLKQEVMIQGSGFIAVAAREAEGRTRKEEKIAAEKKETPAPPVTPLSLHPIRF